MSVADKLFESITSSDFYIVLFAIGELVLLALSIFFAISVKKRIEEWRKERNVEFSHYLCEVLSVTYSLFLTIITIFPLLGMFGTVTALLGVNMAGDMAQLQNRFFNALTSTAWGIIFSIVFKLVNALAAPFVEEQIEESKKLSEMETENDSSAKYIGEAKYESTSVMRKSENVLPVGKAEAVERFFGESPAKREDIFTGKQSDVTTSKEVKKETE